MSLNCVEIEEVIKTLPQRGMIKKIFNSDKSTIIINIFDGNNDYFILCSVHDGYNRICLSPPDEIKKRDIMRFSQILNANISGYRLEKIYQVNYSRIVVFEVRQNESALKLILRLWGTGGNILLVDRENSIIECLRRMPKRDEWPKENFDTEELIKKSVDIGSFSLRNDFKETDINEAVFGYYNNIIKKKKLEKKRNELKIIINKEINACNITLKKISCNLDEDREELYREHGELLKMNIYKIKKGMDSINICDYNSDREITIRLAKNASPSENVEKYFEKYKKIKKGREKWENEKRKVETKLEYFNKKAKILKEIDDYKMLLDFEKGIESNSKKESSAKENQKIKFARYFILDGGYEAYVSKSARDADELLKNIAKGNDYWFHARDYAGSHVVVKKIKAADITEKAKIEAATIAVFYSKGKNDLDADVYFTQVKYLHKSKGGPAGLVFPVKEKNIKVRFDKSLLEKIFSRTNN